MTGRMVFLVIFFFWNYRDRKNLEKYYLFLTILGLKSLPHNRKIYFVGKIKNFLDNPHIPLQSKILIRLSASFKWVPIPFEWVPD